MKIDHFIDLVYAHPELKSLKNILIRKLSIMQRSLLERAGVLMVQTNKNIYAIKIRRYETDANFNLDINKTYDKIKQFDFIELSDKDYVKIVASFSYVSNPIDYNKLMEKIENIIPAGAYIIFKMNIDL